MRIGIRPRRRLGKRHTSAVWTASSSRLWLSLRAGVDKFANHVGIVIQLRCVASSLTCANPGPRVPRWGEVGWVWERCRVSLWPTHRHATTTAGHPRRCCSLVVVVVVVVVANLPGPNNRRSCQRDVNASPICCCCWDIALPTPCCRVSPMWHDTTLNAGLDAAAV